MIRKYFNDNMNGLNILNLKTLKIFHNLIKTNVFKIENIQKEDSDEYIIDIKRYVWLY